MDNLIRAYAARRYAILFYSLLATLIATPLLAVLDIDAEPLEILLALNLLAGALGLGAGWRRRALLSVTIAALLFHFGSAQFAVGLRPAAHAFWAVIAFLTAAAALRFAMSSTRVDAEHLYAALSTYLLGGIFFGVLYHVVSNVWTGSFSAAGTAGGLGLFDGIYFSFVTLATLGYGDVVPVNEVARGLAVIEAIAGQLFLAVMIARLVGSYVQPAERRGKRDE
jgi:voltage-gated potassium channel Kch